MTVRYETINGKRVKLYPAFNTNAHGHDIEFRRNRIMNEIDATLRPSTDPEGRYKPLTDAQMMQAEKLQAQLTQILEYLDFPTTYLPWELYQVARETIGWAGGARSR